MLKIPLRNQCVCLLIHHPTNQEGKECPSVEGSQTSQKGKGLASDRHHGSCCNAIIKLLKTTAAAAAGRRRVCDSKELKGCCPHLPPSIYPSVHRLGSRPSVPSQPPPHGSAVIFGLPFHSNQDQGELEGGGDQQQPEGGEKEEEKKEG